MPKMTFICAAVLIAAAIPATARADFSLNEKKFIKGYNDYLKRAVDDLYQRCKIRIKARIDWRSFRSQVRARVANPSRNQHMNFGYCRDPISWLASTCHANKATVATIASKVRRYVCRFGGEASTAKRAYRRRQLTLSRGRLTFYFAWLAGDYTFPKWLDKTLGSLL